ncbi:HAD family hydrolase [Nocardia jiangsuensis]|uniref:HAD family hydrolase n=1 Tax=Nocardia jiangsuensis TaxID=1691563 RepID=A0ABV8E1C3_9NOCA
MDATGEVPRLIALDVDGTLLKSGSPVSRRVVDAVRAAVAAGAHVVVTTGRSMLSVAPVLAELGLLEGHALCSNGAVHLDVARGEALAVADFDPLPAITALRAGAPEMVLAVEKVGVGMWVTGDGPSDYPLGHVEVVDHALLGSEHTPRLSGWWPGGTDEQMAELLREFDVPGTGWIHGDFGPWLTVSRHGVSKGWALEQLRQTLEVPPAATLAIGDHLNDREMLAWAGHSVAMANAPAEIRAAADEVTADVLEDGVALVLERWFR